MTSNVTAMFGIEGGRIESFGVRGIDAFVIQGVQQMASSNIVVSMPSIVVGRCHVCRIVQSLMMMMDVGEFHGVLVCFLTVSYTHLTLPTILLV